MAYGSFAPVYTHIKKAFIANGRRLELEIFEGLAWFADAYGFCYPGIKRLATVIHRGERTVERALNDLMSWNMVKMHVTENRLRRGKAQVDFQLNPLGIYIREELEPQAWALWGENSVIKTPFSVKIESIGVDLNQTESQPESRPSRQNQNPNPIPNPYPEPEPQTPNLKNSVKQDDDSQIDQREAHTSAQAPQFTESDTDSTNPENNQRESAQNQPDEVGVAESLKDSAPAGGGRVDGKLARYGTPLTDFEAEQLAQYLRTHLPTHLKQARALVDVYGIDHVNTGIDWLNERRRVAPVQNAAGLFVWGFQSGEIPKPQPMPRQGESIAGDFADFFER